MSLEHLEVVPCFKVTILRKCRLISRGFEWYNGYEMRLVPFFKFLTFEFVYVVEIRVCGKREIACRAVETETEPDSNDDKVPLLFFCFLLLLLFANGYMRLWSAARCVIKRINL